MLLLTIVDVNSMGMVNNQTCSKSNDASINFTPFTEFYRVVLRGNFVYGSTSLSSNAGSGTITISGIPANASIVKAFLFWVEEDNDNASSGNFNGNPISGIKIAEDCTACWGTQRNALFYRDVTPFIAGNGTYNLSGFTALQCEPSSDGPEGATLVVVWCRNSEPVRTITIYTGDVETPITACLFSDYSWTHTNFTASNPVLDARYLVLVGNGQNFGEFANEYVYLNNNVITNTINGTTVPGNGPCENGSLWDAFGGNATSWIPANSTSATFRVNNVAAIDCWHPVVSVLSVTSVDAITHDCVTQISIDEQKDKPYIKISNKLLEISSNYDFEILSINGTKLFSYKSGNYRISLKSGVYILKYKNAHEKIVVK
ncbi:MAG: hypothetical protein RMJ38_01200 [candidate division WOR-3 bacterium]|nr:DUF3344 domain-containing protein [candidate division WOR-3 bacterium]MDW8150044.1 hypothetical protein [candidate division WOR-3 bacterium]